MRHRIGVVLAVVMTSVLFFAGAWGYLRLLRLPAAAGQLTNLPAHGGSLIYDKNVLAAMAAVAGTGLLAGILIAAPRISPLATGLPGLLLLGWTGLYLVSVRQAVDLIPLRSDAFGAGFEAMLYNGTLAATGLTMIIPMFVPSRWRSRVTELDDFTELEPAEPLGQPEPISPPRSASQLEPLPETVSSAEPWPAAPAPSAGLSTELDSTYQ